MTREEEIRQAAYEYVESDAVRTENEQLAFGDFINGIKWADEHPKNLWINVKDRLPEKNCTVFVTTNGLDEDVAHFRVKSKRFITVAKEKQKLLKKEESAGSYFTCGDYIKEYRYYSKGEREDITDSVTHWMTKPELKKGE